MRADINQTFGHDVYTDIETPHEERIALSDAPKVPSGADEGLSRLSPFWGLQPSEQPCRLFRTYIVAAGVAPCGSAPGESITGSDGAPLAAANRFNPDSAPGYHPQFPDSGVIDLAASLCDPYLSR